MAQREPSSSGARVQHYYEFIAGSLGRGIVVLIGLLLGALPLFFPQNELLGIPPAVYGMIASSLVLAIALEGGHQAVVSRDAAVAERNAELGILRTKLESEGDAKTQALCSAAASGAVEAELRRRIEELTPPIPPPTPAERRAKLIATHRDLAAMLPLLALIVEQAKLPSWDYNQLTRMEEDLEDTSPGQWTTRLNAALARVEDLFKAAGPAMPPIAGEVLYRPVATVDWPEEWTIGDYGQHAHRAMVTRRGLQEALGWFREFNKLSDEDVG